MPDTEADGSKTTLTAGPEMQRLKEELSGYLQARARKTVTGWGDRLEQSITHLGEGDGKGLSSALAKGRDTLREGGSPAKALASAGSAHLKDTVKDTLKGKAQDLLGKGRKKGGGTSKSVTIVEDIDVGVPVREAYDQWTQFQEFSDFAKGVVSVENVDDTTTNWKVKVAKSTRSWQANVTEQIPDERIAWTTESAKGTVKGVVTFHPVTETLTRVLLVLEYFPKGFLEKTGNVWRAQGRRARLDLKLYRKFVMLRGEATDGWRGEIRDGDVVVDHEQAVREEAGDEPDDGDRPKDEEPPADDDELADDEDDDLADEELPDDEPPDDDGDEDAYADDELADDDEEAVEDVDDDRPSRTDS